MGGHIRGGIQRYKPLVVLAGLGMNLQHRPTRFLMRRKWVSLISLGSAALANTVPGGGGVIDVRVIS